MDQPSHPLTHHFLIFPVSANPPGPLPKGAEMTLLCQVSSPIPPNVHLLWERVNGTKMDGKKSKQSETKVEVKVTAAGMWNCHLMEDNNMKLSLNYTVGMEISIISPPPPKSLKVLFLSVSDDFSPSTEEAPTWMSYTVIGVIIGAGVLMFVFACLGIMAGMSWQRRRVSALVPMKDKERKISPDHRRNLIFSLELGQNR